MSYPSVLNVSNGGPSNPKLTLKISSLRIKRKAQNFASWMLSEYTFKIGRKKGNDFLIIVPEIFKFSYSANLVTDDVIGFASIVVWHKIKNISANNAAMLLKLGRDVAFYKIYQTVHILMLLWQHALFQFVSSWARTGDLPRVKRPW